MVYILGFRYSSRRVSERATRAIVIASSDVTEPSKRKPASVSKEKTKRPGSGDSKRFGAIFSDLSLTQPVLEFNTKSGNKETDIAGKAAAGEKKDIFDALKFIDDEEDQLSEAESFHSLSRHLSGDHEKN